MTPEQIDFLPKKWQIFARSALAQNAETLVGINPEVLHGATLALLDELARMCQERDHWRETAHLKHEKIATLLEEIARLQQETK